MFDRSLMFFHPCDTTACSSIKAKPSDLCVHVKSNAQTVFNTNFLHFSFKCICWQMWLKALYMFLRPRMNIYTLYCLLQVFVINWIPPAFIWWHHPAADVIFTLDVHIKCHLHYFGRLSFNMLKGFGGKLHKSQGSVSSVVLKWSKAKRGIKCFHCKSIYNEHDGISVTCFIHFM